MVWSKGLKNTITLLAPPAFWLGVWQLCAWLVERSVDARCVNTSPNCFVNGVQRPVAKDGQPPLSQARQNDGSAHEADFHRRKEVVPR